MIDLSVNFSNILFIVERFEKRRFDVYRYYFLNGKSYKDNINVYFNEFDETKLN